MAYSLFLVTRYCECETPDGGLIPEARYRGSWADFVFPIEADYSFVHACCTVCYQAVHGGLHVSLRPRTLLHDGEVSVIVFWAVHDNPEITDHNPHPDITE